MNYLSAFSIVSFAGVLTLCTGCSSGGSSGDPVATADNTQQPSQTEPSTLETVTLSEPDTLPNDSGKLNVAAAFPGPNEPRVALVSTVTVQFDDNLLAGQDFNDAIAVTLNGVAVTGSVSQSTSNTLVFVANELLAPAETFSVTLDSSLMSEDGLSLSDNSWSFTTVADVYTTPQSVIDECMSDLDIEMLAAVNAARQVQRYCGEDFKPAVGKLHWNCLLQESAIVHSLDMATHDFFSHTGSDGSTVAERVTATGYNWQSVGENLAAGQRTVTQVMEGLLASPGHCVNIMYETFTEFGFGYRTNDDTYYKRYWTQNFARPHQSF